MHLPKNLRLKVSSASPDEKDRHAHTQRESKAGINQHINARRVTAEHVSWRAHEPYVLIHTCGCE